MFASVVIPTRNAVDRLLYTLYSLNLQYTPFDQFEVIVMDNASTDGLVEQILSFPANYPLHFHRYSERCMPHQLLNTGIAKAKGEIVILLGASMIVPRQFVGAHLQAHAQEDGIILAADAWRRAYSVYYPAFSREQQFECQAWLEHYPQIKRPHTQSKIVRLLDEKQIASGLLFEIALPAAHMDKERTALRQKQALPAGKQVPWRAFQTKHVSLKRPVFDKVGWFRGVSRLLRPVEKDMAKRLWKANCRFRCPDKLILVEQQRPPLLGANKGK
jgi:hypothetical protein